MSHSFSLRADLVLGFFGGGQLARMSALQAFRFGIQTAIYSDRPEDEPAELMTPRTFSGSFDDVEAMTRFASGCDLITLENEFIDSDLLREVSERSGIPIYPTPESFALIENKQIEKRTFAEAGIPVTPSQLVSGPDDLRTFGEKHGWPYLLKSSKGGYDGFGNETVRGLGEAEKAFRNLGGEQGRDILAEAFIDFTHELAVQVARNDTGTVVYPCCETVQENHICVAVRSPAPVEPHIQKEARELALAATEAIDGRGIFAFELFLTPGGKLLLNESAPRPHNSGHYTMEGCVTSQFENHIRAVLGLPLGSTRLRSNAVVMANLLGTANLPAEATLDEEVFNRPDAHLHLYGKLQSKKGRKMGHLTLLGEDGETLYAEARALAGKVNL